MASALRMAASASFSARTHRRAVGLGEPLAGGQVVERGAAEQRDGAHQADPARHRGGWVQPLRRDAAPARRASAMAPPRMGLPSSRSNQAPTRARMRLRTASSRPKVASPTATIALSVSRASILLVISTRS